MAINLPNGYRLEKLRKGHPRKAFRSGESEVDDWIATKALQQQEKNLSVTRVLVDSKDAIAGYYTLATSQVDFGELPVDETKRLPNRRLPVAVIAWFGIALESQGRGLGRSIFAQALLDCYEAGQTFAFVAVIIDCLNDKAKAFYQRWKFAELPENPNRLFLSTARLRAIVEDTTE